MERDQRLAVVVDKPRTQSVIDALQTEGVYDADRSVQHAREASAFADLVAANASDLQR